MLLHEADEADLLVLAVELWASLSLSREEKYCLIKRESVQMGIDEWVPSPKAKGFFPKAVHFSPHLAQLISRGWNV